MTVEQLTALISDVLAETFTLVKDDIRDWIAKKVPRRTGQLRFTLLKALEKSRDKKGIIKFIIGTQVKYATQVNAMSTKNVRHDSTHFEHSGARAHAYYYGHGSGKRKRSKLKKRAKKKGQQYISPNRIFLNDPDAIGGFWDTLLKYFEKRILYHLNNAVRAQYGKTRLPWVIT